MSSTVQSIIRTKTQRRPIWVAVELAWPVRATFTLKKERRPIGIFDGRLPPGLLEEVDTKPKAYQL